MNFNDFNIDSRLLEGIDSMGYQKATPVQELAIPIVLKGKDIIVSAQTGTGKTAAYLLPIIHKILSQPPSENIKALILVPTRELALQIDNLMEGLSYFTSVSSIAVYGGGDGNSFVREQQALAKGADVVICTPGRMLAHLNTPHVKLSSLQFLVLDEADRMLDIGFYDDIMKFISYLPTKRQNLMFSATMPTKIRELAKKILHEPEQINISISKPPESIKQYAYVIYDRQKLPLIKLLLQHQSFKRVIIFCSTKQNTKLLNKELKKEKLAIEEVHSDLDQDVREQVLLDFRNRKLNILVATDILSRGIDVEDIELVVNYDVPNDGEDYVHRIGRTARAESKGMAITFVNEQEQHRFSKIEELLEKEVPKAILPEELGSAPLYEPQKKRPLDKRAKFYSRKR